jgi:hypothetical protein
LHLGEQSTADPAIVVDVAALQGQQGQRIVRVIPLCAGGLGGFEVPARGVELFKLDQ